ncbi:autotransporter-associated beta strand repeat-containing protein [Caulobacter radicis]|uniref:autotransporter-associated beta strand repeat-containing protein n=1 Tax=Caulobacter radicis TaxID=2172650 RepID=UPI000E30B267|nr:autotransporter-associated beta strand repeat-containing protein [Caulobacter radicis]
MRQSINKARAIRNSVSLTVLALAVGLGAPMAQARQITQGGGAGAGFGSFTPAGGVAGGGGGASGAGSYGGAAAGTPTGSAEAGANGSQAGGQPGALNDLSAGGGGGGGGGLGGNGGLGWQIASTGSISLAVDFAATDGANGGANAAGGGGGGGLVLTGANVQLTTAGYDVTGGDGGEGRAGGGGGGGGGGAGLVLLNGGSVTVNGGAGGSASAITGGTGSSFGNGGAGLFLYSGGALNVVSGTITGGAGGTFTSWGGAGAAGVLSNLGTIANAGTITGGEGGYGYSNGGAAGIGVIAWGGTIENSATGVIAGGVGGQGNGNFSGMYSGAGGAGIVFTGGQPGLLVNAGTIQGGAGGPASNAIRRGAGGRGVVGASTGSTTIINSGTIIGGVSVSFQRAYAIELFGSDNRLELHAGSWIRDVVAVTGGGSNNVLALGGADDDTFDAMHIGSDGSVDGYGYMGFDTFEKLGASTWTLTGTGDQTWSVREGVLKGDSNSLAGSVVFGSGAGSRGVVFDQAFDGVYRGQISTGGAVTKTGAGTLTLTGESASNWTISGGGVIAKAGLFGSDASIGAGAFLTLDQSTDGTYGFVLSGAGDFRKAGSGKLVLTEDSSGFTGATTVGSGTLTVNGSLAGSTVTVASGATLGGTGAIGAATIQSGGHLAPGNSVGSLSIAGDLTLASGSNLDIELGAPGGSSASPGVSDRLIVSGDLALNGVVNLSQSAAFADGVAGIGYYRLITYGGALTANTATIGTTPSLSNVNYALQAGSGRVDLYISNAAVIGDNTLQHWQGGSGVWSAANTQWLNDGGNAPAAWAGKYAIFKDAGAFTGGLVTVDGAQSFIGLQFVDDGYELTGTGQLATAPGGSEIRVLADVAKIGVAITGADLVTKTQAGTLILTGANTYTGGTLIDAGTLQIGDGGTSGSIIGNVGNRGVLVFNRSDAITFAGRISGSGAVRILDGGVTFTADNIYAGGTTIASGAQLNLGAGGTSGLIGDAVVNGGLTFDRSDSVSFSGVVSGSGALRQVGSGNLILTSNSSGFTGTTAVDAGRLTVNGSLADSTLTVASGATLGGAGAVGDTVIQSGGHLAPGSGGSIGSVATLSIAGDLTLASGSNLDIELVAPGASSASPGVSDRVVVSGDLALNGVVNLSQTPAMAAGLGYYRLITYGGALTSNTATIGATPSLSNVNYALQAGGGRVDLFIASTLIPGDDTLQHWQGGDGVWSATSSQWLNQGGNVPAAWAGKYAIFRDAGAFTGGEVTVTGAQSFRGLQFVDEGYELGGNGQLVTVAGGSEIRVLANQAKIGAAITGAGGIVKTQAGTLILTGANTYAGGTTIQGGALQIGDGGTSGSIVGDVVNDAALYFRRSDAITFDGRISGTGGAGILSGGVTFTANNTYAGGTTIASGAQLTLGAGGTTGTIAGDVLVNGALAFNRSDSLAFAGVIDGSGLLRQTGSGKLVLTGDSSGFTGATSVDAGTLAVNGSLGRSTVTVASGATLGGTGTVGDTIVQSGGHLAPGNSVGSLSIAGDLTLASGANLDIELGAPGAASASPGVSDRLVVSGDLALNGVVNLSQSAALADGVAGLGYYRLITYGGALTANTATVGATPSLSNVDYTLQAGSGRVDLFISTTLIPGDDTLQHWQGGDGVWRAANPQWLNQGGNTPAAWAGNHAIFKDAGGFTGGRVSVEGAQSFLGLQFVDEGYELTGTGQLVTAAAGSEIRVLADAAKIGVAITGAGGIVKTEAGTLILTGANTYGGGASIRAGTLQIGDGGTSGSIVGDVANNGVLAFDRSDAITFGGLVSGSGAMRILGGGVTFTANNTYAGGTTITSGAQLNLGAGGTSGSIRGDVVANGALAFDRSDNLTFAGAISGSGALRQIGAGKTELTGASGGFTGATMVERGTLAVNGVLGGMLDVWSGARLQGVGTVGTTVVSGTIAPGNSIGTLNVAGGVTFKPGSVFEVEADVAGQSDKIVASGVATIQGGIVRVLAGAGTYRPETSYVILHANGGLAAGGKFDGVTSNLAFLDPSLRYDGFNVYLRLRRNDISFADIGVTSNQVAAGAGAEHLGWDNPVFDSVVNLSTEQARDAFDQLAGSDYASLRGSLIQDSRFVRDAILARGDLAGVEGPSAWGETFGGWGSMKGDGNAQSYDRDVQGFLTGYDGSLGRDIRAGVAVGYSAGDLKTARAKHDVETYHLGGYVLAERGGVSFQLGGAYAWHAIKASRRVAFGTFGETLASDYSARTYQAFGEVAVKRDLAGVTLQPYAGLAYVALTDADVSERGGSAALHGGGDDHLAYGSVGVRLKSDLNAGELNLRLTGSAALRHAFGDRAPSIDLSFTGAPSFGIVGAPIDKDSLAVNLGLEADLGKAAVLGVTYSGSYGDRSTDHGARAQISWRF